MINTFLSEFAGAWRMFIRLPLPIFLQGESNRFSPVDGQGSWIRPLLPLLGLVLGLFIILPLWVLTLLPSGRITSSLAAAVLAPLFLEIAMGWEELNALATFFDLRRHGATQEEALLAQPQSMNTPRGASSGIILMTIYILRMIFLGVLGCFAPFWIPVTLAASWMIRAELLTLNKPGEFGTSCLKCAGGWEKRHWITGLIAMFCVGFYHPFGVLLAFGVAWLLAWVAVNLCLESISGISKQALGVFACTSELILFFLGLLLYAAPK